MNYSCEIIFNGETRQVRSATIQDLLEEFSLSGKKVAVELNQLIVPRDEYRSTPLTRGDRVEIVHFVGGG